MSRVDTPLGLLVGSGLVRQNRRQQVFVEGTPSVSTAQLGEVVGEGAPHEMEVTVSVRGTLHIYSCPPALCPHVEWALAHELGTAVTLTWRPQSMALGMLRTEGQWQGPIGASGRLATVLKGWAMLRYDVTEEPSPGCDGERYSFTPALGLFHATTSANGDIVIREDRLRAVVGEGRGDLRNLMIGLSGLLGSAWDGELEPYRRAAADGPPENRLTRVV